MIHLAQLIFVKPGKEPLFHEFEEVAIPLMEKYGGRMLYRLRPGPEAYVGRAEERPYEVHIMSFPSSEHLRSFLNDGSRKQVLHMKEDSVRATLLIGPG